jgi:hypothetical protein
MSVRLTQPAPRMVPRYWHRGHNRLVPRTEPRVPEPTQLYHLTTLYLLLHAPRQTRHERQQPATRCACCGQSWPCEPIRLAYRLREGF